MKISPVQRIILINQYNILEHLDSGNAEKHRSRQDVLRNGWELEYDSIFGHVDDGLSETECREVYDILTMYSALNRAYRSMADKSGIGAEDLKFEGFDGNGEGGRLGYVRYLIHETRRWPNLAVGTDDDFNSHIDVLDKYRRMLVEWQRSVDKNRLTKDDISRIMAAQIYPEHR